MISFSFIEFFLLFSRHGWSFVIFYSLKRKKKTLYLIFLSYISWGIKFWFFSHANLLFSFYLTYLTKNQCIVTNQWSTFIHNSLSDGWFFEHRYSRVDRCSHRQKWASKVPASLVGRLQNSNEWNYANLLLSSKKLFKSFHYPTKGKNWFFH